MSEVKENKKVEDNEDWVKIHRIYPRKDSLLYREGKPIDAENFKIKDGVIEYFDDHGLDPKYIGIPLCNVDYYTEETVAVE